MKNYIAVSVLTMALVSCGGSTVKSNPPASAVSSPGQVLPVRQNPIKNAATTKSISIGKILVEDNTDPVTKKAASDHLEIPITNTGPKSLAGFEVYYTVTDAKTNASESYYTKLPDSFTIEPGATRTVHFDKSNAADHFPVNQFGLFTTSKNALAVTVVASATDAAPETATVNKDAGGAEQAD